jgi:hypothetical protein
MSVSVIEVERFKAGGTKEVLSKEGEGRGGRVVEEG